ncbi:histidine kinase [Actinokineospora auranticolor]|uniref:histidine kinase n=1 Tax=Actinokineospora auranticolor TaxID=155976 RepID=A0A2S6GNA2_9PSEU|nr:histidine kinase [Actinokineospora auranticolor]PPK66714.1 signal transduction histidine kinase [Actinokineospora auranticolor]
MAGLLGPVFQTRTYRRWAHLVLGGALFTPCAFAAGTVIPPATTGWPMWLVVPLTSLLSLLFVVVIAFIPAVRVVEVAAARELLGDKVPEQAPAPSWSARWRFALWFLAHLVTGAIVSGLTLAVPPAAVVAFTVPYTGELNFLGGPLRFGDGWQAAWVPFVGIGAVLLIFHLATLGGAALTRAAPRLLGPSTHERLAWLEHRAGQLAERNRLARELHDSVGHALSVVTVQAAAARRVLDTEPEFVERALAAIEDSARSAVADLDHVLGLLRAADPATKTPQWTLKDLPGLLERTRLAGAEVTADLAGDLDAPPAAVSREAYRIVQECLTNALRHAGTVPVGLRLDVGAEVELEIDNPIGDRVRAPRAGGGQGLVGMRERVEVLGGHITAGPEDGRWVVRVRLPLGRYA